MGTSVEYNKAVRKAEELNSRGFEGDVFMKDKFKSIIEAFGIKTFIETGTYHGATTRIVSEWVRKVYTIELNAGHMKMARKVLIKYKNVDQWGGNSPDCLDTIFKLGVIEPIFIFLDAHWDKYNPLLDELSEIARAGIKPILAIHDFKVPGHPELGYDSYEGQDYDIEWIQNGIASIYGEGGYTLEYNSDATGAKRGVLYVYPKA